MSESPTIWHFASANGDGFVAQDEAIAMLNTAKEHYFKEGLRSVTSIRCSKHHGIPAYNAKESAGGECAACAIEPLRKLLDEVDADNIEYGHQMHDFVKLAQSIVYLRENGTTHEKWAVRGIADDAERALKNAGKL